MLKTALLTLSILMLALLFQQTYGLKSLTSNKSGNDRANKEFANSYCHNQAEQQTHDQLSIYRTAAGFDLHIPGWVHLQRHTAQFNQRCELLSIHLNFFIVDGHIHPIAHHESGHQNYKRQFGTADRFTAMLSFKRPIAHTERPFRQCENKELSIDYPEYHLEVCPSVKMSTSKPAYLMSHFPVFFFKDKKGYLASLTCSHRQLEGYRLHNIHNLDVEYPCRGYWSWRDDSFIMFDISKGQILKKTYRSIKQTEDIINSWLVAMPKKE
ncbi:hypothetical protein [Agaribacterium sp. ZY112]|uniref:hypothetical protein n=1 Tax=Agaribacterium sp. ZY112 TaxID=3233574 RepID=UPI00352328BC